MNSYLVSLYSCSNRILGFRRAPLVIGRFVNLRTEIKPVATEQLLSTFMTLGRSKIQTNSAGSVSYNIPRSLGKIQFDECLLEIIQLPPSYIQIIFFFSVLMQICTSIGASNNIQFKHLDYKFQFETNISFGKTLLALARTMW